MTVARRRRRGAPRPGPADPAAPGAPGPDAAAATSGEGVGSSADVPSPDAAPERRGAPRPAPAVGDVPLFEFEPVMSDSDALLWRIERDPTLRSTVVTVIVLEAAPDPDRLRRTIERVTRLMPRLRDRVVTPPGALGPPRWVPDPDFTLDYHLRRVLLPAPGELRGVLDAAATWAMGGFDRDRPPWEVTVVEGLADGRAAVVTKFHHALVDGVGGLALAMYLFDASPRAVEPPLPPDVPPAPPVDDLTVWRDSLRGSGRRLVDLLGHLPGALAHAASSALVDPEGTATEAAGFVRSVTRLLAPGEAPLSPVMTGRSTRLGYDVLDVSLEDLKRAGRAGGGTLNDAFVAAITGGLRRYHEHHGRPVDELRMTMPVNRRDDGHGPGGNVFTPVRASVPVAERDPVARMQRINAVTAGWRAEPALEASDAIAAVLDVLPGPVVTGLFGLMLKHVDFVASNVPGVEQPLWLAGCRVHRWYPLGPPAGAAANVTLLSYHDTCCIGLTVDPAAVPDAPVLRACLQAGFDEVVALVR